MRELIEAGCVKVNVSTAIREACAAALEKLGSAGRANSRGGVMMPAGTAKTTVGIVGLGAIRVPIARRVLGARFRVRVHSRHDRQREDPGLPTAR
jgi:phosphoglycerate dehydrogenase-like enzyme